MQYLFIPPHVFTLWDPTSLQYLLQCEILKPRRIIADGCKIIVGLVKLYNGKVKILSRKINLKS